MHKKADETLPADVRNFVGVVRKPSNNTVMTMDLNPPQIHLLIIESWDNLLLALSVTISEVSDIIV